MCTGNWQIWYSEIEKMGVLGVATHTRCVAMLSHFLVIGATFINSLRSPL